MTSVAVTIPGIGEMPGGTSIVILGPNGCGKTQLAKKIAEVNQVSPISAQRRTWVNDSLPVQEAEQLRSSVDSTINQWRSRAWQPTDEIDLVLSTMIQEHATALTTNNELAIASGAPVQPVRSSKLIVLQHLWSRLFPKRKLEIGGFFPRVQRLDSEPGGARYHLREMSDGERTALYMAARVMIADKPIILIDEPELHMHSRLSVQFWDEAQNLRPDCRFVYITHDLSFALSRRGSTVVLARSGSSDSLVLDLGEIPASIASEVLGAATLPFYARRIFLYEGEPGRGFASALFSAWFDGTDTFAVPCGDRSSVCAAVAGLRTVGVVAAEIVGLVDRDFDSDECLAGLPSGVRVLSLHEIESVLCDQRVVRGLAEHFGRDPEATWSEFLRAVRSAFRGKTLSSVVARRVRARVGDLLDGAFRGAQILDDLEQTKAMHVQGLEALGFPSLAESQFEQEARRVADALASDGGPMLAVLPGKHLLALLSGVLGFRHAEELFSLVVAAIRSAGKSEGECPVRALGCRLESALLHYLPPRRQP